MERLTYTADSIEATTAALNRLPNTFSMTLGVNDRANLIQVLRTVEATGLCNMQQWAEHLRTAIQDGPIHTWPRVDIVNLIALLYIVAWNGHKLGFNESQCDWSRDFYSSILETLDIELV